MSSSGLSAGSFHQRVFKAFLGNGFSLATRAIVQFAQVPLFLFFWSADTYGEWLLLYSIPSYLALADFGMGDAGANAMVREMAAGRREQARAIFAAIRVFIAAINMVLLLALGLVLYVLHAQDALPLHHITGDELTATLFWLGIAVCASLAGSINFAGLRGIGRYPEQSMIWSVVSLIELGAIALALAITPRASVVAAALAAVRVAQWLFLGLYLRFREREVVLLRLAGVWAQLRALIVPSLGFMAFPIANAILFQGYNILVGLALGAHSLVVYSASATASRVLQMVFVPIYSTLMAEAAILLGRGRTLFLRNLHRAMAFAIGVAAPLAGFGLFVLVVLIFPFWVQRKVELDMAAFIVLILVNVLKVAYYPSFGIISAATRHLRFSTVWTISAGLALAASAVLAQFHLPLWALLMPLLAVEVTLYVIATSGAAQVLDDRFFAIVRGPAELRRIARLSLRKLRARRG
ncbi:hypothetical protein P6144_19065 [Sphingomonas sp. HITSZ_GF]|uniref:lipopolysaccharide biosynthesis protein n=1 Tax=Sphingomonas sp. HITSZ_GF TaxID=3037247 RepID=UPI00240CFEF1|nr:hypothetical protein [Sphingomonas sp. HITSZ_GF]MDG2535770.1 hypothetical protein [Sphingomonas sp. HITSZ_GF]